MTKTIDPADLVKLPHVARLVPMTAFYAFDQPEAPLKAIQGIEDTVESIIEQLSTALVREGSALMIEVVIYVIYETLHGQEGFDDRALAAISAHCFNEVVRRHFPHRLLFAPGPGFEQDDIKLSHLTFKSCFAAVRLYNKGALLCFTDPNDAMIMRMTLPHTKPLVETNYS